MIARGETRATAIGKMARVLRGAWIDGVNTNLSLHNQILADPDFISGGIDTNFLTRLLDRSALAPKLAADGVD